MLTALDLTEGVPMLTDLDLTEGMPMLTALDPTDGRAILTAPDPNHQCMAFLTTPDLTAEPVEVGRLLVPGSTEDDLNICPNHHHWHVRATSSMTSETRTPTSRTTPKETSSRPTTSRSPSNEKSRCASTSSLNHSNLMNHSRLPTIPSNRSRNQSCLSALRSTDEWDLNL
jgi:hypothetical protein